jgi:hypothetical protein
MKKTRTETQGDTIILSWWEEEIGKAVVKLEEPDILEARRNKEV